MAKKLGINFQIVCHINLSFLTLFIMFFALLRGRWSYGVMAITLDFESNNPSSSLGRTFLFCQIISTSLKCKGTIASTAMHKMLYSRFCQLILSVTEPYIMSHGADHNFTSYLLQKKSKHDSLLESKHTT